MEPSRLIEEDLRIPRTFTRQLQPDTCCCLVPEIWCQNLLFGKYAPINVSRYNALFDVDPLCCLASSTSKLPKGWNRCNIITLQKSSGLIKGFLDKCLTLSTEDVCTTELLHLIKAQVESNTITEATARYDQAVFRETDLQHSPVIYSRLLCQILEKLFHCPIISFSEDMHMGTGKMRYSSSYISSLTMQGLLNPHPNIVQVYAVLESENTFYVVQKFSLHSLWDLVSFSPNKLLDNSAKAMFILYQVLKAIQYCHRQGVAVGPLTLNQIAVDENVWVRVKQPSMDRLSQISHVENKQQCDTQTQEMIHSPTIATVFNPTTFTIEDLPDLVQQWTHGELSNFDYLMILNWLSGRQLGNPNHHPVLPWVTDFSSPEGNLRDLTKSKYRLNKGDRQLDLTYNPGDFVSASDSLHVAHHISDVLSDITYYVYKARRTSRSVLCSHVRAKWVPHEYPSSMARLQEWTPDECIPEFFTDPELFTSIHDDLHDLSLPSWTKTGADFIAYHHKVLEGDAVSRMLHHWIDLTFGYKLSGPAAVKARNVCLQLVDSHSQLLNHGVIQLFHAPHPRRCVPSVPTSLSILHSSSPQRSKPKASDHIASKNGTADKKIKTNSIGMMDASPIIFPRSLDPLAHLTQLENLMNFSLQTCGKLPPTWKAKDLPVKDSHTCCITQDMQGFGCLVAELFLSKYLHSLPPDATLLQRYSLTRKLCSRHWQEIPRAARSGLQVLLALDKPWSPDKVSHHGAVFMYDPVSPDGMPPPTADVLLSSGLSCISFPPYFEPLYQVLHKVKVLEEREKRVESSELSLLEKVRFLRRLAKERVTLVGNFCQRNFESLGTDGADLFVPYVSALWEHPVTTVQAVWTMFAPVSRSLGPKSTASHFLPLLVQIFDNDQTTPKYMKIYHRSFIIQLIVRLGLECFLANFSTLLIEAVGAYKNFHDPEHVLLHEVSTEPAGSMNGESSPAAPEVNNSTYEATRNDAEVSIALSSVEEALIFEFEDEIDNDVDQVVLDEVFDNQLSFGATEDEESYASEHTLGDNSSTVLEDTEEHGSDQSGNGEDANEDALGKSVGRLSLHSVSRLILDGEQDHVSDNGDITPESETAGRDSANGSGHTNGEEDIEAMHTDILPSMVRSETEEFTSTLMSASDSEYNICDVAAETVKWLAHRLGPVLTAKFLSRNLLKMLALCYLGNGQLEFIEREGDYLSTTKKYIVGDVNASQVLECLSCVAILYGENFILQNFFHHVRELIFVSLRKLTLRAEAGLISCVTLLCHILPYFYDSTLMDILQDTLFRDMVLPLLKVVSNIHYSFPSGSQARSIICYKLIDVLYIISLRIGFEMTRQHMTFVLQKFFAAFNRVYEGEGHERCESRGENSNEPPSPKHNDESSKEEPSLYVELKIDPMTKEYKMGKPTTVASSHKGHRRQSSLGSHKHSLSPPQEEPEEGSLTPAERDKDQILQELKETFTPELAHAAYIPFCKLAGGIHMEQNLINDDLIRQLCALHDQAVAIERHIAETGTSSCSSSQGLVSPTEDKSMVSGSFGRNVSISGNKIMIQDEMSDTSLSTSSEGQGQTRSRRRSGESSFDINKLRSPEMKLNCHRHLKGNWLAYWEHESGRSDQLTDFNFKQIKLQTFKGHNNSVRSLCALDSENSFLSASKDKTVKLWSLRSFSDGNGCVAPQGTYSAHKKSVFTVSFLDSIRLVASCDSNIHIWDPFMCMTVRQVESAKNSPITVMCPLNAPSTTLLTACPDSLLRFFDVRTGSFTHEFKCTTSPIGPIRCICQGSDNNWVAVGHTSGVVSTLDLRTGFLIASWKAHESEILQIKPYSEKNFLTSSIDQTISLWGADDTKLVSALKGHAEPVHCLHVYRSLVISGTTANKVGVHTNVRTKSEYSSSKLKTDVFRGVLSTMAVLPMNKLLLLASDNGEIRLVA